MRRGSPVRVQGRAARRLRLRSKSLSGALSKVRRAAHHGGMGDHAGVNLGIDLVQISRIGESVSAFGERFLRRVFTPSEIEYAQAASDCGFERLASRFAAKEAAIKALGLSALGGPWRDIEVQRSSNGAVALVLHGRVAKCMQLRGLASVSVSMSHEGDWATAVVAAVFWIGIA